MSQKPNRRRQPRSSFPPEVEARVVFGYPFPGAHRCVMPLRDLSPGGMAFTLNLDLPGLDVGQNIEQAELIVGEKRVRGEILVMHLTPGPFTGAICGALFFPVEDEDISTYQELVASVEPASTR
ncbi:MAG: PilZ domain-containing protein [Acidobacteriota bacterium]